MRSKLTLIGLAVCAFITSAFSAAGQEASPTPVPIGSIEETEVESTFERMTFVGMIVIASLASELNGSVEDPVAVFGASLENAFAGCDLKVTSAPDIGDSQLMYVGTASADEFELELVALIVQDGDYFAFYLAGGLVGTLTDFIPTIQSVADRDPDSAEEWLVTLEDLPPGFTASTEESDSDDSEPCAGTGD